MIEYKYSCNPPQSLYDCRTIAEGVRKYESKESEEIGG